MKTSLESLNDAIKAQQRGEKYEKLVALIANTPLAMTFQTIGTYRGMLLKAVEEMDRAS